MNINMNPKIAQWMINLNENHPGAWEFVKSTVDRMAERDGFEPIMFLAGISKAYDLYNRMQPGTGMAQSLLDDLESAAIRRDNVQIERLCRAIIGMGMFL